MAMDGMGVLTCTKYGMGVGEFGDRDINMLNMKYFENLKFSRCVTVTRSQGSARRGELTFVGGHNVPRPFERKFDDENT